MSSPRRPASGLFIVGTDTGVGKTYVGALLVRALADARRRVGIYKPAASGCRIQNGELVSDDAVALWTAAGRLGELRDACPQCFVAPLAPHLAARAEGRELDAGLLREGLLRWADRCDLVIVEGAGGLLSPLGDDACVADLALEFGYPLVIVAPNVLGVINQALQTVFVAQHYRGGLPIAGVVLNDLPPRDPVDASRPTNAEELRRRLTVPLLAHIAQDASHWPANSSLP